MHFQFVTEIKEHKIRALKTLFTCLCYICIGLQGSGIGVSFLDLKVLAACTLSQIAFILSGGAIGYAGGSVVAGFLESKFNIQLVIAISLGLTSICQFGYPLSRSLVVMIVIGVNAGFFSGIVDCFSNIFILKLWAKECPPFLQALHFCFGIGSFVAPLITAPFLKEVGAENQGNNFSVSDFNATKSFPTPEDIEIIVPFSIIGAFTAFVSLLFFFLYIKYRETTDHPSRKVKSTGSTNDGKNQVKRILNTRVRLAVIIITSCFFMLYSGIEQTIGHLLPVYAHDGPLQLEKKTGAKIAALYWITYTCFRLVAVLLSGVLSCVTMLTFNMISTIVASITLCAIQTSAPGFWFSCALMGIGLSSTWGSMFAYLESHFPVHGRIVATLTVGAAIGSSCTPAIIGYLMGIEIVTFAWFPLFLACLLAILFLFIHFICKLWLYSEGVEKRIVQTQISIVSQVSQTSKPTVLWKDNYDHVMCGCNHS